MQGKTGLILNYAASSTIAIKRRRILEEAHPVTGVWAEKSRIPTGKANFHSSVVNGRIYAIGGSTLNGQALQSVEEYDTGFMPKGESVEPEGKLPTAWGEIKSD